MSPFELCTVIDAGNIQLYRNSVCGHVVALPSQCLPKLIGFNLICYLKWASRTPCSTLIMFKSIPCFLMCLITFILSRMK